MLRELLKQRPPGDQFLQLRFARVVILPLRPLLYREAKPHAEPDQPQ